jgi:hypothetical protein
MPDESYIYKEGTTPATVVNHDEAVDQINSRLLAADTVMVSERKIMADGEQVGLVQSMEIVLTNGGGSDVVKFKVGQPDGKQVEVVRELGPTLMVAMGLTPVGGGSGE